MVMKGIYLIVHSYVPERYADESGRCTYDYMPLFDAIKNELCGGDRSCCEHVTDESWFVFTDKDCKGIYDTLLPFRGERDTLLVTELTEDSVMLVNPKVKESVQRWREQVCWFETLDCILVYHKGVDYSVRLSLENRLSYIKGMESEGDAASCLHREFPDLEKVEFVYKDKSVKTVIY